MVPEAISKKLIGAYDMQLLVEVSTNPYELRPVQDSSMQYTLKLTLGVGRINTLEWIDTDFTNHFLSTVKL